MKTNILNIILMLFVSTFFLSCAQNESSFGDLVKDNKPAIPVLITGNGVFTFGGNPTLPIPNGGTGAIEFTVSVPASSGRKIKEITAISAGGTGVTINAGEVIRSGSVKLFPSPVIVGANEYKFSTTVAAVKAKYPALNITPIPAPAPTVVQTFRLITFIFLVTLDDDQQIVSVPVDCRLMP